MEYQKKGINLLKLEEISNWIASDLHEKAKAYAISKMDDSDFIKYTDAIQSKDGKFSDHDRVVKQMGTERSLYIIKKSLMYTKFDKFYEKKLEELIEKLTE